MQLHELKTWEQLQKKLTWMQLGQFTGKTILEFGCGNGVMGAHYAAENKVIAIEPNGQTLEDNPYENVEQICGNYKKLADYANELLDGKNGISPEYGAICYYEDDDLMKWALGLKIDKILGMRTFWDLQQSQEIQEDEMWQKQMMELEQRVSEIEIYKNIAFFHHVFLRKK